MQVCPRCERVYDESEYCRCPYCSGELEDFKVETKIKTCPLCDGIMRWYGSWECSDCDHVINTDEDDYDGVIEE